MRFVKFTNVLTAVAVAAAALAAGSASAHEGDVAIKVIGGKIVTGDWIVDGESLEPCSVFAGRFNDTGSTPNWIDEPGFDSAAGTWTYPSSMSFNILDALRVWDGSDFDTVAAQTLAIAYAGDTRYTPLTEMTVAGFSNGVSSNGAWHRHYGFTLGNPADDGIYLLKLELTNSVSSIAKSDPFYIVLRQDENQTDGLGTAAQLEAAMSHLESVPEPGTLSLLAAGLGAMILVAWRRRRRA
jgi:hypothetical protein